MTIRHTVDYSELVYGEGGTAKAKLRRQQEVIPFFEEVEELGLKEFL